MATPRKVVQIAVASEPEVGIGDTLFALADDGTLWSVVLNSPVGIGKERWLQLGKLPDAES